MWKFTSIKDREAASPPPPLVILVIQADAYDWSSIFSGTKLNDGREVHVVQTGWQDILIHADTYSIDSRPLVEVRKSDKNSMTVQPDFVLIRNEVLTPSFDGRQLLSGLMFADVPSINSLQSIYLSNDRAAMMGYLHRINRKLGDDVFPVIKQHFASGYRGLMYGYAVVKVGSAHPVVVKVGSAHAGAGKMQIADHHQMSDFRLVQLFIIDN